MYMPADWLMQPFRLAFLPCCSSLFPLFELLLELLLPMLLLPLDCVDDCEPWSVVVDEPVWSEVPPVEALPDEPVPDVEPLLPLELLEPPPCCAIIEMVNSSTREHVSRTFFIVNPPCGCVGGAHSAYSQVEMPRSAEGDGRQCATPGTA